MITNWFCLHISCTCCLFFSLENQMKPFYFSQDSMLFELICIISKWACECVRLRACNMCMKEKKNKSDLRRKTKNEYKRSIFRLISNFSIKINFSIEKKNWLHINFCSCNKNGMNTCLHEQVTETVPGIS